jgi:hypothetical protein
MAYKNTYPVGGKNAQRTFVHFVNLLINSEVKTRISVEFSALGGESGWRVTRDRSHNPVDALLTIGNSNPFTSPAEFANDG